jgi:hypothetical protein
MRRSSAGLATCVNWCCNLAVSVSFLSLLETAGAAGTFALYAAVAGVGVVALYLTMPETAGLPLEAIHALFATKPEVLPPLSLSLSLSLSVSTKSLSLPSAALVQLTWLRTLTCGRGVCAGQYVPLVEEESRSSLQPSERRLALAAR